ncbi:hypothetical protein [Brevibacillus massiliensis]|jgi:hypothetical protein|nr:hypothetical protein [Brevibacillus massiliensis]
MDKYNHLDQLPIAALTPEQLEKLRQAEEQLNQNQEGNTVYLIALSKETG